MHTFSLLHCFKSQTAPGPGGYTVSCEGNRSVGEDFHGETKADAVKHFQKANPSIPLDDTGYYKDQEKNESYIITQSLKVSY